MAKFLTTDGISAEITNIIKNAKNEVTLITPYLRLSDILFERLKDAGKQGKKINLVYGKDELKPDEKGKLKQLDNLLLYFSKDLHAKCYYNEECMVIASMNLHEYSQQHNKEMGVLLTLEDDHNVFNEALTETKFIVSGAEKDSIIRNVFSKVVKDVKSMVDSVTEKEGYCIRCGRSIPYDLDKPLCPGCFSEWKVYENPDYKEHCCHTCGRQWITTIEKPLCRSCYDRLQR